MREETWILEHQLRRLRELEKLLRSPKESKKVGKQRRWRNRYPDSKTTKDYEHNHNTHVCLRKIHQIFIQTNDLKYKVSFTLLLVLQLDIAVLTK